LIAVIERCRRADADAVDLGAEEARKVLENVLAILAKQARVPARNILLRQADDVAFVSPDGHLVTVERKNNRSSFIVFDNQFMHYTGFPPTSHPIRLHGRGSSPPASQGLKMLMNFSAKNAHEFAVAAPPRGHSVNDE
jgi:hypothetical protein